MTLAWRLLSAFLMLTRMSAAAADAPLGRLFFTPEQRAAPATRHPADSAAPADVLVVDGIVSRSDGKSTVWVNGRPRHENVVEEGLRAVASPQRPGLAVIMAGQAVRASLRAGETLDRRTGRRQDVVAAGAVRIHADHGSAR